MILGGIVRIPGKIFRFLDINCSWRRVLQYEEFPTKTEQLHWIPQWLTLFLGIIVQPFLEQFRKTHVWKFDGLPDWTLFALITSVIISQSYIAKILDEQKPLIVLLGPIFTAGLGWETLMATATKVVQG
jgi:hypothetical protein